MTMVLARADQAVAEQYRLNLPHAVLLVGEIGLDTKALSQHWADAVPSDTQLITPEAGKKHISIQQIRDLRASMRTYVARRRVVIIRPASAMTEEAQNALLKLLEEPLDGTHFLLETVSADLLLPTIVSRCQIVRLHRTSPLQDNQILKKVELDAASKQQILFLANGRPELIRRLANQPKTLERYKELAADAKQIISQPGYQALKAALAHSKDRQDALDLVDMTLTLVKAQARARGINPQLNQLSEKLFTAEHALYHNGNIRLILTALVV